jgi:hypothetical protein
VGLTAVLGGGIFSSRSNRWGGGEEWGYNWQSSVGSCSVYGGGGGGGLNLCVNLVGGCVDSAVGKILLPRKIYRTVTAPPHSLNTKPEAPSPPPPTCATVQSYNLLEINTNL